MLTFLVSAAAAHAHPSFELGAPGARAGEPVRFTISDVVGPVSYELEVDDEDVLEGTGVDGVTGSFTMPDLGDDARKVTVEAEIRTSKKRKKIKQKLGYLGAARPVPAPAVAVPPAKAPPAKPPPAAAPPPPAAAAPPAAPPPPVRVPNSIDEASHAPQATKRAGRRPHRGRTRRAGARPLPLSRVDDRRPRSKRGRDRRGRDGAPRKARRHRPRARTAPLFDGVPERGAGRRGDGAGVLSLNAIEPRRAVLAATGVRRGGGPDLAIVVPALLGLGGLALAGTALLRRRRLASGRR